MSKKQYGLIIPNEKTKAPIKATRALNPLADSDDELEKSEGEEAPLNWVELSLKKSCGNLGEKSQQKRLLREALVQDATAFEYDAVFDDMKASEQNKQKEKQKKQQKSKYIEALVKHSESRKLESERRIERKVQRERELEGDEFADKEAFVTPAFLRKQEELRVAEAEEEARKAIEEKLDVHKHKNFGVFYNHLLTQRLGEEEAEIPRVKSEPQEETADNEASGASGSMFKQRTRREFRSREGEGEEKRKGKESEDRRKRRRSREKENRSEERSHRRKRSSSREGRRGSNERERHRIKEEKQDEKEERKKEEKKKKQNEANDHTKRDDHEAPTKGEQRKVTSSISQSLGETDVNRMKMDVRIARFCKLFAMRTVGEVRESALQSYLERRAERGARGLL